MTLNNEFSQLEQFLGGYFHQDWMDEFGVEEMAIKAYAEGVNQQTINNTLDELDKLLSLGLPEAALRQMMVDNLLCEYNPDPDGISMTNWLHWVRNTLAKYAAEKAAKENKSQA